LAEKRKSQWRRKKFQVCCCVQRVYNRVFRWLLAQCPRELAGAPKVV
jgi:hypothetical protein